MRRKISIIAAVVLVIVFYLLIQGAQKKQMSPTPTPVSASWEGITPGLTSVDEAKKILGSPIAESGNILDYVSKSPTENDKIVSENGKVIFVRHVIAQGDDTSTKQITKKYGLAPVHLYGPESSAGIDLFVYPAVGIAYLGNQSQDFLFEIWYFQPMPQEQFIEKWARGYSTTIEQVGF